MEGDLKTSTAEFIVQVAPQMVCDQKQKEIVKRSEGSITNNALWRCWKTVIEVLATGGKGSWLMNWWGSLRGL